MPGPESEVVGVYEGPYRTQVDQDMVLYLLKDGTAWHALNLAESPEEWGLSRYIAEYWLRIYPIPLVSLESFIDIGL